MNVVPANILTKLFNLEGKILEKLLGAHIHNFISKVPSYVKAVVPSSIFIMHEKAWNCYPYCRTGNLFDLPNSVFYYQIFSIRILCPSFR